LAEYYDELFKLCGFEDGEIDRERVRIEKVLHKLEISPQDVKSAESWVRENHDVELMGVRKVLGVWLSELVDLVLAKDEGKRIVYFGFPSMGGLGNAITVASENVYCGCPDVVLCHTMGQIFNKLGPILEAGEQNGLPPGHALCTLQTIRVGALALGIVPEPDMVLTSSYYCDMGSKTDELLHERYGHPAIYVDGSMDSRWGEFPDFLAERVEFTGGELNKLVAEIKEILGVEITQEAWDKGQSVFGEYFGAVGKLVELMRADPQPISLVEMELARFLATGCTGRAITEAPRAIALLNEEVAKRVEQGIGVVEKGAPRIGLFIANFSDPRIAHMIENAGLAIGGTLLTAPFKIEPWQSVYTSLGEKKAEVEMKIGIYHGTYAVAKRWAEMVEVLKLDGSICGYHYNCRPLAQPSHLLPKFVQETTGVPVLSLEMDYYDCRNYSAEALRTRVETFAEMLRVRKASAKV